DCHRTGGRGALGPAAAGGGAGPRRRPGVEFRPSPSPCVRRRVCSRAAAPSHRWAPDVYEGAPTPITALLSVGSKAASFAMLMRIFIEGLPAFRIDGLGVFCGEPVGWRSFFYLLAVVSMTVGNVAALTQSNTKRMLAY